MKPNRLTLGALAATAAVLLGAGAALAASTGTADRSARCDARIARIAERRGVTVEQLTAQVRARLLARIDAVGHDSAAFFGLKGCGKLDHGPLPVSFANPSVRFSQLEVMPWR